MSEGIVRGDGAAKLRPRALAEPRLDGEDFTESNYAAIVTSLGVAAGGDFGRAIPTVAITYSTREGDARHLGAAPLRRPSHPTGTRLRDSAGAARHSSDGDAPIPTVSSSAP